MTTLLSKKQEELIETFKGLIAQYDIELIINDPLPTVFDLVSLDVEHDEEGNCVGIGLCQKNKCWYYTSPTYFDKIILNDIIAHNGISDFECLRQWGINVKDEQLVWDTLLMGHIVDSSLKNYGLKAMAKRELDVQYPTYDDIVGKRTAKQKNERCTLDKQPVELVAMYNAMDCYVTYKLWQKQNSSTCDTTGEREYFDEIEKPVSQIFNKMSNRGIRLDLDYLVNLKYTLEQQKKPIEDKIKNELGDINLNSPKQLLEALNAKGIYPELKDKPSTDKRALAVYQSNGIVSNLLKYSELDTLLSTFVAPYLERNQSVVHPFFNQCGTRTGRLSCSNPNLLQIPRRTDNGKLVRRMFIPRDGMLLGDCDFGQIEPRVLAHLSKDAGMCDMFNNGTDFHAFTASKLGISRDRAKVLNLSVGYRATFKSVASQLKCSDKEAQNEIDKWWSLFPTLRRYQDTLIFESKRLGYCNTLMGRRIKVDGLTDGNRWQRESAERQLINNITQGSAAEIMKLAMIKMDNMDPQFGLLVQVYDELLFESDDIEASLYWVKYCMENAVELDVPLTVDGGIGPNWAEAKK
jgi:DNA polymerase-1